MNWLEDQGVEFSGSSVLGVGEYWVEEMWVSEYSFAIHWFIAVNCFDKDSLRILTFPCSSDGSSSTISPGLPFSV